MRRSTTLLLTLALVLSHLVGCSGNSDGDDMLTSGTQDEPSNVHPRCEEWVVSCLSSEYMSKEQASGCWDCVEQCGPDVWATSMCEAVLGDLQEGDPSAEEQCSYAADQCEWASEDPEADTASQTYTCSACVYVCSSEYGGEDQAEHCEELRP